MQPEELIYTECPTCHVVDTRLELPYAEGPARSFPLVRCRRCGLVFQQLVRSYAELKEGQSEAYGVPQRRFIGPAELGIRIFRSARARKAMRLMPAGGRTLDIGCGRAAYLRLLKDRGYEVRGTELSPETAANADPAVPVDVGDVEPGGYPDRSFDLISIWHVLEHLQTPDRVLHACFRALEPGGALMLAVPNYGSLQAALTRDRWFHLDLPRHIFHFRRDTLEGLVRAAGFEIESCATGQWEMDPFGWAQSLLNRAGLRHNGLYDTLRNVPAVRRDLGLAKRLGLLAVFPLLMALACPLSGLLRLLGRAGTLVLIARRPSGSEGDAERSPEGEARDHRGGEENPGRAG